MGKLDIFEISFADTSGVFYAGTLLKGHVTVDLSESMKMRGIKLQLEGAADVSWSERENDRNSHNETNTRTIYYSATEKYFDESILLFGSFSGQGSDTTKLSAGRHEFPFQFQLPTGLPSSFEGSYGHVRYLAKCRIDKPWKFDHNTKCPFTIISILDLNQQPNCSQGLQESKEKTVCCCCCASGPIHASFHIDRQGYVPGEAVKLYAEITNGSNKSVKSFVTLKMLTVNPSGPSLKLNIPFEIIIGTIPLASVVQEKSFSPFASPTVFGNWTSTSAPSDAIYSPTLYKGQPELPRPTYNESITGKVSIRDKEDNEYTRGTLDYAPAYTYYNWGNTPSTLP